MPHDGKESAQHVEQMKRYLQGVEREARRRENKASRKKQPHDSNKKSNSPRSRDWDIVGPDDWDDSGVPLSERVMPMGSRERLRSTQQDVAPIAPAAPGPETGLRQGRVTAFGSGVCKVEMPDGRELACGLRGGLLAEETAFTNPVAVGDRVLVAEDGLGGGVVEAVLPRASVLTRPDVLHGHRLQPIVANADHLLIVSSWRTPALWPELIDRCLIAARQGGLSPVLCVNKADLIEDEEAFEAAVAPYRSQGLPVIRASARTGEGVAALREVLRGVTTALAGLSGTGKSSLLAAVQPGLRLRTSEVSVRTSGGRHTTTQAVLIRLEMGGAVVDTPGIREFGVNGLRRRDLASAFPEIAALASGCRFADCLHAGEPDCAVRQAALDGRIAASRYRSYGAVLATLPA
jgi:ribosome biogenesis GTPase